MWSVCNSKEFQYENCTKVLILAYHQVTNALLLVGVTMTVLEVIDILQDFKKHLFLSSTLDFVEILTLGKMAEIWKMHFIRSFITRIWFAQVHQKLTRMHVKETPAVHSNVESVHKALGFWLVLFHGESDVVTWVESIFESVYISHFSTNDLEFTLEWANIINGLNNTLDSTLPSILQVHSRTMIAVTLSPQKLLLRQQRLLFHPQLQR